MTLLIESVLQIWNATRVMPSSKNTMGANRSCKKRRLYECEARGRLSQRKTTECAPEQNRPPLSVCGTNVYFFV
jgi:hypothetical protein